MKDVEVVKAKLIAISDVAMLAVRSLRLMKEGNIWTQKVLYDLTVIQERVSELEVLLREGE